MLTMCLSINQWINEFINRFIWSAIPLDINAAVLILIALKLLNYVISDFLFWLHVNINLLKFAIEEIPTNTRFFVLFFFVLFFSVFFFWYIFFLVVIFGHLCRNWARLSIVIPSIDQFNINFNVILFFTLDETFPLK